MSASPSQNDVNMVSVKEENECEMDDYQSIFEKLKKLHDIAKTNNDPSGSACDNSGSKLAPKRKTDLDLDGLSDDSALNSSNKNKRRRFSDSQDYPESGEFDVREYCSKRNKMHVLSISNLPGEWTYERIKQYVVDECGVNVLKMIDSRTERSSYQLRLRFSDEEHYQSVLKKLRSKEIEGKLKVDVSEDDDDDTDSDESDSTLVVGKRDIKTEDGVWRPDSDDWDHDRLYGLKPEFLKSLNINPPLVKWLHVTNFRCDKSELKDVFEMAGRVVSCVVTQSINRYAKIMYSHPLEAVQAISMLNGQIFYGQSLIVTLDPFAENTLPLPKGLLSYGPGLGEGGKPLRDVVNEYERYKVGKPSTLNTSIFSTYGEMQPIEPYIPTNIHQNSEASGKFGPIGQKKNVTNASSDVKSSLSRVNSYPFSNSPRPGPSNTPSFCPRPQNNSQMFPNRMVATPPLSGPTSGPIRPPMPTQNMPNRMPGPNMQCSAGSNYQGPSGPFQGPPGSNFQGGGPHYQGPPGPNFQGPPGPSFPRPQGPMGPNYQGPLNLQNQNGPNYQSQMGPHLDPPHNQGHNQIRPNFPGPPGTHLPGPGPNQNPIQGPNSQGPRPNFPNSGPSFQGPNQFPPNRFPPDVRSNAPFNQRGPMNNVNGPPGPRMCGPGPNQPRGPLPPPGPNQTMGPLPPGPMGNNGPQEKGVLVLRTNDAVALQITNLPPTVTLASLCGKLSKVGRVVSLEFTNPGNALVRFGNPSEAERCFHYYSPARFGNDLGR